SSVCMLLLIWYVLLVGFYVFFFFFSSRRRHTRFKCDWSSDVCSSDLPRPTSSSSHSDTTASLEASHIGRRTRPKSSSTEPRDTRSEERRVGKECRSRWSRCH